jgi:hypothetical protein
MAWLTGRTGKIAQARVYDDVEGVRSSSSTDPGPVCAFRTLQT